LSCHAVTLTACNRKQENLMKKFMMTTALVAGSMGIAHAQDATTIFRTAPEASEIRASDLIGMRIYREEGEAMGEAYNGLQEGWDDIGEINDVILSRDGSVEAVLVDIGGFLGMGESQVAVDMQSIRFVSDDATDVDDFFLVLNAPREVFETAPMYDTSANGATGTLPADGASSDTAATTTTEVTDPNVANTATAAQTTIEGQATTGSGTMVREGWNEVAAAEITSETLTGATVYGPDDQSIGEVSDLVLTADGQVQSAIVDVGGFLGMGEKPVQLDLSDLDIVREVDGDELRIYIAMTREQVEALPNYEG
jgi:sporulation protein YlmC with PRC-barrel domain